MCSWETRLKLKNTFKNFDLLLSLPTRGQLPSQHFPFKSFENFFVCRASYANSKFYFLLSICKYLFFYLFQTIPLPASTEDDSFPTAAIVVIAVGGYMFLFTIVLIIRKCIIVRLNLYYCQ